MSNKIERIDPETLLVGIDIAKHIHWAQMTDNRGIALSKPLRVENTAELKGNMPLTSEKMYVLSSTSYGASWVQRSNMTLSTGRPLWVNLCALLWGSVSRPPTRRFLASSMMLRLIVNRCFLSGRLLIMSSETA